MAASRFFTQVFAPLAIHSKFSPSAGALSRLRRSRTIRSTFPQGGASMNVSNARSSWRSPRRMSEPAVSQKIAIVEKCSHPSLPPGKSFLEFLEAQTVEQCSPPLPSFAHGIREEDVHQREQDLRILLRGSSHGRGNGETGLSARRLRLSTRRSQGFSIGVRTRLPHSVTEPLRDSAGRDDLPVRRHGLVQAVWF